MGNELRTFAVDGLEVRQLDGQPPVITGYAVVFDSWSDVMTDGRGRPFRERIAPTAFDRALASNGDVRALWNHNSDYPLGRTGNGTLRILKDGMGLLVEVLAPATSWGQDAVESIRRGDVAGMSFAFSVARTGGDTWARPGPDGVAERTLLDADLYEVSPVVFPAYTATWVGVRSVSVPEFEDESSSLEAGENRQPAQTGTRARDLLLHLADVELI